MAGRPIVLAVSSSGSKSQSGKGVTAKPPQEQQQQENKAQPTLNEILLQHGLVKLAERFSSGAAKCCLDDFLLMQQAELRQWTEDLNELDELVKAWRYASTTCSQRLAELQQQSSPSASDSDGGSFADRDQCALPPPSTYRATRTNSMSLPRSMKPKGRLALMELEQSDQHDSGCVADTGDGSADEPPSNLLATSLKLGNSEPNIHSPLEPLSARPEGLKIRRRPSVSRPRSMFVSSESVEKGPLLPSPDCISPHLQYSTLPVRGSKRDRRWSITSSGYNTSSSPALSVSSSHDGLHHLPSHPTQDDFQGLAAKLNIMSSDDSSIDDYRIRSRSRSLSPSRYPAFLDMPALNRVFRDNFPKAKLQMEENLKEYLDGAENEILKHQHADATVSFVTKQLHELASQLLGNSNDGTLSNDCFHEMTENILRLFQEISQRRSSTDTTVIFVQHLVHRLLSIMSRPARLLECLEFDPETFYQQVGKAGADEAQEKLAALKSSHAVPRYIQGRLKQLEEGADEIASRCMSPAISRSSSPVRDGLGSRSGSAAAVFEAQPNLPGEGEFETVKLISNGAYSSVHLVRHKTSSKLFAMKKVSKINMIRKKQVEQAFCERDILTFAENPFVVSMICTFQTKTHLCMVLEYVEGGDCATLLKGMQGPIPLELARLYFAETVLALEYLHNYGVVHRDMKPDNLLITSEGHVKLTDFGLSKMGLMSYATTMYENGLVKQQVFNDEQVYGTPDYIAPEVILRSGYGFPVDWWAMGIILYEFLVGLVPFYGESVDDLFEQITSEEVEPDFPDDPPLPEECVNLIRCLLVRNAADRLGTHGTGAEEVKNHIFFKPVHWRSLLLQKAEFVPHLDNPEDTSYFDPRTDRYDHTLEGEDEIDGAMQVDLNSSFQGFSSVSPRFMAISSPNNSRRTSNSEGPEALSDSSSPSPHHSRVAHSRTVSTSSNASTFNQIAEGDEECGSTSATPELNLQPPTPCGTPGFLATPSPSPIPPASPEPSPQLSGRPHSVSSPPLPEDLVRHPEKTRLVSKSRSLEREDGADRDVSSSPKPGNTTAALFSVAANLSSVGSPRKPPTSIYTVERGPQGYGMELRAIRVYLGESDKYCVQHIVKEVTVGSNAWKVGIRDDFLITSVDGVEVGGLKHTDLVQLLLGGGKKSVTFAMVPLEDTTIMAGGRKRLASVSRRVSSREETNMKGLVRTGSAKRRSRISVPAVFSRSRNGSRKRKESKESGNRSRSNSGNTAISPTSSAAPSQPTTPSPVMSRSNKSSKFSFGRLAKILNPHKSRRPSLTVSPLALESGPGSSSTMASPTGNSPPTTRSFSSLPISPSTVTGAESAASVPTRRLKMRRSVSSSHPTSPSSSATSPMPSPCSLPPILQDPQHAAVMQDILTSGSPMLRRALSPESGLSCASLPLELSSPLASGSISTPNSPSQPHMRRSVSTATPPRSRSRLNAESQRKLSWEERTHWFNTK